MSQQPARHLLTSVTLLVTWVVVPFTQADSIHRIPCVAGGSCNTTMCLRLHLMRHHGIYPQGNLYTSHRLAHTPSQPPRPPITLTPEEENVVGTDPTPPAIVDQMIRLARIQPGELVCDPGCGDGRLLIAAARLGARGIGFEINAEIAAKARRNVRQAGMGDRVVIWTMDCREGIWGSPDVVLVYLYPDLIRQVLPKMDGARVISYAHAVPNSQVVSNGDTKIYVRR